MAAAVSVDLEGLVGEMVAALQTRTRLADGELMKTEPRSLGDSAVGDLQPVCLLPHSV